MGADYIYEPDLDRDSLQREGVQVILGCDGTGIPYVKVSHQSATHVRIYHNDDLIGDTEPTQEEIDFLAAARDAEEAKKTREERIAEKLGALPASATVEEVVALVTQATDAVDAEVAEAATPVAETAAPTEPEVLNSGNSSAEETL